MAVLWISFFVVLLDQLTKLYIKGSPWSFLPFCGMPYGSSIKWIDDLVRITYIENPGMAFNIVLPQTRALFPLFSLAAAIGILWVLIRKRAVLSSLQRVALALVLGGAVGNMIDRMFYGVIFHSGELFHGQVVDFIDFGYRAHWWPVFNVADSAVTCGVAILIGTILFQKSSVFLKPIPPVAS